MIVNWITLGLDCWSDKISNLNMSTSVLGNWNFYFCIFWQKKKKKNHLHLIFNRECNILQWVKENIPNIKGLNGFSLTASKALLYSASFSWLKMQYFAKKSTAKKREEDKDKPLELVECILTGLSDCTGTTYRSKSWLLVLRITFYNIYNSDFQLE